MTGKTCVITGANSGIGFATAKGLAEKGAHVLLLCRNEEKGRRALKEIRATTGNDRLELYVVDLASQKQIRAVGRAIRAAHPVVDVLVNNAGTWISERTFTEKGIEKVFAVNHLAYVLLTHMLYPSLRQAPDARIVNVASDNHYDAEMQFEDLYLSKNYHGLRSYAQSKLGNVMFTMELDRRKPDENVSVNAVQPGLVYTDIGLKDTNWLHALAWKVRRSFWKSKSPEEGAATSVFLAASPEARGESGKYWDNCRPKPPAESARDPEQTARLWEISLELCEIDNFFDGRVSD
ncbi:MAG: SDR family oxidoreductase [Saprospiraceae bacterium]|nr:SDR family oxidoreductase [Saprospiraceae bacterium]